jgi:hypothetical protein
LSKHSKVHFKPAKEETSTATSDKSTRVKRKYTKKNKAGQDDQQQKENVMASPVVTIPPPEWSLNFDPYQTMYQDNQI